MCKFTFVARESLIELAMFCGSDYSLHGGTISQCVSGEWTPSPDTVIIFVHTSAYGNCHNKKIVFSTLTPTSDSYFKYCDVYCSPGCNYNTKYDKRLNIVFVTSLLAVH